MPKMAGGGIRGTNPPFQSIPPAANMTEIKIINPRRVMLKNKLFYKIEVNKIQVARIIEKELLKRGIIADEIA